MTVAAVDVYVLSIGLVAAVVGGTSGWFFDLLITLRLRSRPALSIRRTAVPRWERWLDRTSDALLLGPMAVLSLLLSLFLNGAAWAGPLPGSWLAWPAGAATTLVPLLVQLKLTAAMRRRARGLLLARHPALRATRTDGLALREWLLVTAPRRAQLAVWAALPGGYLVAVAVLLAFSERGEGGNSLPLLGSGVAGGLLWGAGMFLFSRALPAVELTRLLLVPVDQDWRHVDRAVRRGTSTATLIAAALDRRRRRIPRSLRDRYARASFSLIETLQLARDQGHSRVEPREAYRDTLRIAARLAVGPDALAALVAYDTYAECWEVNQVEVRTDSVRWIARLQASLEEANKVVTQFLVIPAIVVGVILGIRSGTLADVISSFR